MSLMMSDVTRLKGVGKTGVEDSVVRYAGLEVSKHENDHGCIVVRKVVSKSLVNTTWGVTIECMKLSDNFYQQIPPFI